MAAQAAPPIAVHSATNRPAPAAADPSRLVRRLQTSDPVVIRLLKSPQTEQYEVVIDELGCVTLPFIGAIKIGGLTPQEAERLIEKTYIEEQYYQKIDVNVLAQQGEYYVSGEVKREGKYQLTGDTTLRQAIATAGGYTEFANRRRIHITRGRSDLLHDAEAIEKGAEDPFIRANDTIKVERKSWP